MLKRRWNQGSVGKGWRQEDLDQIIRGECQHAGGRRPSQVVVTTGINVRSTQLLKKIVQHYKLYVHSTPSWWIPTLNISIGFSILGLDYESDSFNSKLTLIRSLTAVVHTPLVSFSETITARRKFNRWIESSCCKGENTAQEIAQRSQNHENPKSSC